MPKKAPRTRRPRVARRKVMRRAKRNFNQPEQASLTEVLPASLLAANQNYSSYNLSLSNFVRARDIAKGYQYYRIKRVTIVIKPTQDTFQVGGNSLPYLYYMIDRVGQFRSGFTLAQLQAMGAKPRRVDDKTITFSYTPSVLTETYDNTALANIAVQYKMCPWLPTRDSAILANWSPNTTDHFGIVWRMAQDIVTGSPSAFSVERRVEIQFKKPSVPTAPLGGSDVPENIDVELTEAL